MTSRTPVGIVALHLETERHNAEIEAEINSIFWEDHDRWVAYSQERSSIVAGD